MPSLSSSSIFQFLGLALLFLLFPLPASAQYSAVKVKTGVADADKANLSTPGKKLTDRAANLAAAEQEAMVRGDMSKEWRLGYYFQAWFIMTVQYRSIRLRLTPEEAETCANSITAFGQKFRKAQKELALDDAQMFEALGKNPAIPETYADYWPSP